MKADLHLHTTCSDGKLTPSQLVQLAYSRGLQAISITDHDTVDGVDEALKAAEALSDFKVIPGIEINAYYDHQEIHILGYFLDHRAPELSEKLKVLQYQREDRTRKILEKLNDLGYPLSYKEVLSKVTGSSIGRPHIGEAMADKGYVASASQAFDDYLNLDKPAYVPREKLSPYRAIDIIKKFGGVPVLAHPGLLKDESIIKSLIGHGLMGIEVYHIAHTPEQSKYFITIAQKQKIISTGGSDSHDSKNVGTVRAPKTSVLELKEASKTISTDKL